MSRNNGNGRLTMDLPELAKCLGVSRGTIYSRASQPNGLPVHLIIVGKRKLVARRDVEELLGTLDKGAASDYRNT